MAPLADRLEALSAGKLKVARYPGEVLHPVAVAVSLGIDPVWFGIYIIIVAEIGLVTPPVGVNVYVIKTVAKDVPLGHIFLGCLPFVAGMLGFVALMAAFPQIALVLVR